MKFSKIIANVFQKIAKWFDNNPQIQNTGDCIACDAIKAVSSPLDKAISDVNTTLSKFQTHIGNEITKKCNECKQPNNTKDCIECNLIKTVSSPLDKAIGDVNTALTKFQTHMGKEMTKKCNECTKSATKAN